VIVARKVRSRATIQVHHAALEPDEVTVQHDLPVTTPPRTLLDLAAVLGARDVRRAAEQAETLRLTDTLSLGDVVARHPHRPGAARLRALLAREQLGATITRSELEQRFLAFLDDHDLPRPGVNVPLALADRTIEADCLWPAHRLIVELDGHASHATTRAFERDRARDRVLQAAGWRVIRITWRQLHQEPRALAADLRRLLAL
jgi:REase_MTES_1575